MSQRKKLLRKIVAESGEEFHHGLTEPALRAAGLTFEEWTKLNHWWRIKTWTDHTPIAKDICAMMVVAGQNLMDQGGDPINPKEFYHESGAKAVLDELAQVSGMYDNDVWSVNNEVTNWHNNMVMRLAGHVYSVTSKLAKMLKATSIKDVQTDMVRLPHRVMFIEIPKSADLQVYHQDTGWHPVEGAYLIEFEEAGERYIKCQIIGSSKNPDNLFDDCNFHFVLAMGDHDLIDDVVADSVARVKKAARRKPQIYGQMIEDLFAFVLNVLLYSTSVDADIVARFNPAWEVARNRMRKAKSDKKRKRLADDMKKIEKRETSVLGSRLVIEGKLPLKDSPHRPAGPGSGRRLKVRKETAGHWRGVWRGSDNPERAKELGPRRKVPKWIRPYMRGPEMAELVHSEYEVKAPR